MPNSGLNIQYHKNAATIDGITQGVKRMPLKNFYILFFHSILKLR
jgi:hypothetical protein